MIYSIELMRLYQRLELVNSPKEAATVLSDQESEEDSPEAIPFQGEPMPNPERTIREFYGL